MSGELAGRTVLIADDHRLFAEGLAALLRDQQCHSAIVTELDQISLVLKGTLPDLLILDLAFGDVSAMSLLRQLREEQPELPILVITASEEVVIVERVRATGAEYLAKSRAGAEVVQLVHEILTGKHIPQKVPIRRTSSRANATIGGIKLTRSHIAVLRLLRIGHSNAEIATTLGRTIKTVESHVSEIYARTGLNNRARLVRWANQHSWALGLPAEEH